MIRLPARLRQDEPAPRVAQATLGGDGEAQQAVGEGDEGLGAVADGAQISG
jgi:hypothetical protein